MASITVRGTSPLCPRRPRRPTRTTVLVQHRIAVLPNGAGRYSSVGPTLTWLPAVEVETMTVRRVEGLHLCVRERH